MIVWRNPAALLGLLTLVAPVLIHLLRRQRARRVAFPSIRFVRAVTVSSARFRAPSDVVLLALRLAILAAAVAAVAGPVLRTSERVNAWNAHAARALVIDASESMQPFGAELAERASAESAGAAAVVRIETSDLRRGLVQAAAWLETAAPARREIVVLSDLQSGALDAIAVAAVPGSIGIRFVQVGSPPPVRTYMAPALMSGARLETTLSGFATRVKTVEGPRQREGLRLLVAERDAVEVPRLLQVLEDVGTPAPSPAEPIVISFPGAQTPVAAESITDPWMRRTIARFIAHAPDLKVGPTSSVGPTGHKELLIQVDAEPSSFAAAAVVRAVLVARAGPSSVLEEEVLTISRSDLVAWSREAPPVGADIARSADVSDARWFWLGVIVLFGVEGYVRRRARGSVESRGPARAA